MRKHFLSKSSVLLASLVVLGLVGGLSGCASSKSASAEGANEIQGSVPAGADAEFHAPPKGPEVLASKTTEAPVDMEDAVDADSGVVSRAALNKLIGRGPGYVFGEVETKPVHAGQKFVGFELVAMSSSAQQAVGSKVQTGDVITHLNGVQQRLPDDYLRAWKMLGDAQSVKINLIRDGEAKQVIWRVE